MDLLSKAAYEEDRSRLVIWDVPLLLENGLYHQVKRVIVVTAPEEVRIARMEKRNGYSRQEALARIHSQMPDDENVGWRIMLLTMMGIGHPCMHRWKEYMENLCKTSGRNESGAGKQILLGIGILIACVLLAAGYFLFARPALLKLRYKLEYEDVMLHQAEESNLDPALVASVIFAKAVMIKMPKAR